MGILSRLCSLLFFIGIFISPTYVFTITVPAPIIPANGMNVPVSGMGPNAISVPAPVTTTENSPNNSGNEEEGDNSSGEEKSQDSESSEENPTLDADKKHVHRYVDKLLGLGGDTEDIAPETLNDANVFTQVKNLQKNIKALQISLENYERSKKSSKSKASILYSKIKSAFLEYFGGDFPDSTEKSSPSSEKKSAKRSKTLSKSKTSRNSILVNKKYTVKTKYAGVYPTKTYGESAKKSIDYPTKFYGNNGKYTVKTLGQSHGYTPSKPLTNVGNYPTKSYGNAKGDGKNVPLPTGKYTVKDLNNRSYFKKKCCGK